MGTKNESEILFEQTISTIIVLDEFRDNREREKVLIDEMKKRNREFTPTEKLSVRMRLCENHPVRNVPRIMIIDNPFARVAFPDDLFNGPFDERWRWAKDCGMVTRVFMGESLEEYEALHEEVETLSPES